MSDPPDKAHWNGHCGEGRRTNCFTDALVILVRFRRKMVNAIIGWSIFRLGSRVLYRWRWRLL